MSEQPLVSQEIIIVRRNSGDGDGGHHGGAWKIAYADFVTAMMAFFLVMWLVNSANEVTKSRVASYFNPIKMTDAAANTRGLKSITDKKTTEVKDEISAATESKTESEQLKRPEVSKEELLLEKPFSGMDEIVSKATSQLGMRTDGGVNSAIGDPFDPKAWEALRNGKLNSDVVLDIQPEQKNSPEATNKPASNLKSKSESEPISSEKSKDNKNILIPQKSSAPSPVEQGQDKDLVYLDKTVKDLINKYKSDLDITVDVRKTDEGLLIKLGDNSGKGMFAIGSAEPSAGLIEIVGVIGKLLSQQSGGVVVRGHTDGRRYRKGRRDNWQLSTARAHMASYMLMRGGLDEARIKSIEGHGSATPLLPLDPIADANRRVEFLLQHVGQMP